MDKTSFLKNKRGAIILSVAVLSVVSFGYGIVKIKNNIAEQQKKISDLEEFQKIELEEKNKIAEIKKQEEGAIAATEKESAEQKRRKQQELAKNNCEILKKNCANNIEQKKEKLVKDEKDYKEAKEEYEEEENLSIKKLKGDWLEILDDQVKASEKALKDVIESSDCIDYEKPC